MRLSQSGAQSVGVLGRSLDVLGRYLGVLGRYLAVLGRSLACPMPVPVPQCNQTCACQPNLQNTQ